VGDVATYEGHSGFLRWWPKALLLVGAIAFSSPHSRIGYVLHDGLLYVPDQRTRLYDALTILGYEVV